MSRSLLAAVAAAIACPAALLAQDQAPRAVAPTDRPPVLYEFQGALNEGKPAGDFYEHYAFGGFRFRWPQLQLEVRGQNGLLLSDREAVRELVRGGGAPDDPPRRGIAPPAPRRRLTPEVLQQRVQRLLGALGRSRDLPPPPALATELPRYLYFEGGVLVFRDGVEVARCERLWISPLDDRMVVEDAELRWFAEDGSQLVARGARLQKQGPRWTGRDVTVTSCTAGSPHAAVVSGELELLERDGQFEVWIRGNALQLGGVRVVPLPDAHFFSSDQSAIPIRSVAAGYSSSEGARGRIGLGMPMQDAGGAVHEWLTGRPAHEFRGDWELGLGWIELRGWPIDGALSYRADGLYEGRTEAFWMNDSGPDLREILTEIDGTPIDATNRTLIRSENRVHLGATTHLDLTAFHAGDAAVYSEFFTGDYRERELPETSVYLHHRSDNVLVTLNGRFTTDDFSYRDNRALAPFFTEELPVATVHWLAQPIAETPWETPLVLDAATEVGQRRRAIDDRAGALLAPGVGGDRTLRVDQIVELSAPFHLGPVQLRPFGEARFTYYDHAQDGDAADRTAWTAGVTAGTRLSRTWSWLDDAGGTQQLRHVIAPRVTVRDRFAVAGVPGDFRQFDEVDALTEQTLVRFEVRNLLQRMGETPGDRPAAPRDVVLVDLAQDLWPDSSRDNGGDSLGLLYYDVQVRPEPELWPLDHLLFGVYGDHDWRSGLRTFDAEVQFGKVAGLDWTLDYRRDAAVDAAVGIGAHAALLGRWDVSASAAYDFERDDVLSYWFGVVRDDHDWSVLLGVGYDPFLDEVSFRMEFQPGLFGRGAARNRGWLRTSPGGAAPFDS